MQYQWVIYRFAHEASHNHWRHSCQIVTFTASLSYIAAGKWRESCWLMRRRENGLGRRGRLVNFQIPVDLWPPSLDLIRRSRRINSETKSDSRIAHSLEYRLFKNHYLRACSNRTLVGIACARDKCHFCSREIRVEWWRLEEFCAVDVCRCVYYSKMKGLYLYLFAYKSRYPILVLLINYLAAAVWNPFQRRLYIIQRFFQTHTFNFFLVTYLTIGSHLGLFQFD